MLRAFLILLVALMGRHARTEPVAGTSNAPLEEVTAHSILTNAMIELTLPDDSLLKQTAAQASDFSTNMPQGEARARLDVWLASKPHAFARVSQGLAVGRLQFPGYRLSDLSAIDVLGFSQVSKLKCILGRIHAEQGRPGDALREFLDVVNLGRMIMDGKGVLIHYVVGLSVQARGLAGIRWLAAQKEVTPAVLQQILDNVPPAPPADPGLAEVYRNEFINFSVPWLHKLAADAADPTNQFPVAISRILDVPHAVGLQKQFHERLAANALKPWPMRDRTIESDAKNLAKIPGLTNAEEFVWLLMSGSYQTGLDNDTARKWKNLESLGEKEPDILGRILAGEISDHLNRSVYIRTEINMTRTLAALRMHQRATGDWPESLHAIETRTFSSAMSPDLFTGKPLLYSREKRLLWSAGPDEHDDGGDPETDMVLNLADERFLITRAVLTK